MFGTGRAVDDRNELRDGRLSCAAKLSEMRDHAARNLVGVAAGEVGETDLQGGEIAGRDDAGPQL